MEPHSPSDPEDMGDEGCEDSANDLAYDGNVLDPVEDEGRRIEGIRQ